MQLQVGAQALMRDWPNATNTASLRKCTTLAELPVMLNESTISAEYHGRSLMLILALPVGSNTVT